MTHLMDEEFGLDACDRAERDEDLRVTPVEDDVDCPHCLDILIRRLAG